MKNRMNGWINQFTVGILVLASILLLAVPVSAQADQEFNVQVSPSPLAVNLTPGKTQTATINVRNLSNHSEQLVPELNGFHLDKNTNKIELDQAAPAKMAEWTHFGQDVLNLNPGATTQLTIAYDTPADVGFSYTAAITLSRSKEPADVSGAKLKGKVVIFNLVNINRPDAKRELKITGLETSRGSYEFLPVKVRLTIQNLGNVIDQPSGNLFIQRSFDDSEPISALKVNNIGGYILPGTSRTFELSWDQGFPVYKTSQQDPKSNRLNWDWRHANQFRLGKYVAKVAVVYNDGQRDVPLIASTDFWVVPWRLIVVAALVVTILVMGLFGWGKLLAKGTKKVKGYVKHKR